MKNKISLYSIGNQDSFNYYLFDKKQEVAELLSKVFYKVFKLSMNLDEEYDNKKKEVVHRKRRISKLIDYHETFNVTGKDDRIDIFYGKNKMFVSIHCSQKLRKEFNEELSKISKMPNEKLKDVPRGLR